MKVASIMDKYWKMFVSEVQPYRQSEASKLLIGELDEFQLLEIELACKSIVPVYYGFAIRNPLYVVVSMYPNEAFKIEILPFGFPDAHRPATVTFDIYSDNIYANPPGQIYLHRFDETLIDEAVYPQIQSGITNVQAVKHQLLANGRLDLTFYIVS